MATPTVADDTDVPADIAATLVDPTAYADNRIHDAYRWLRANNPLGVARPDGYAPFWVVTRHAHIAAISRQNELFHNADRPTTLHINSLAAEAWRPGGYFAICSLAQARVSGVNEKLGGC